MFLASLLMMYIFSKLIRFERIWSNGSDFNNGKQLFTAKVQKQGLLLLWIFDVFFCFVFAMPLCVSVYMCIVVTCWERSDLLALF